MKEIVRVKLENEMDLILANKRTMKLAELCGLSLMVQTSLATAVSEIGRCAITMGKNASLILAINTLPTKKRQIIAVVCNTAEPCGNIEAINFAKRLIPEVQVIKNGAAYDVQLTQDLKFSGLVTESKIESFIEYFKTEPPLSPYDEIRRKNIQLLEFSDQLKASENQYRELTDTLPLMMFLANPAGEIIYSNQWLKDYFGVSLIAVVPFTGQEFVHPDDHAAINNTWNITFKTGTSFQGQARLKHNESGDYLWHLISIVPVKDENNIVTQWTGFFVDIDAQKLVEETLQDNVELKEAQEKLVDYQSLLERKISELNTSNNELEQFAYIASHDLQEPLRKIVTFSSLLGERLPDLDADSQLYFSKIVSSSNRMTELINDVLGWSMIARTKIQFSSVDLNEIVEGVKTDFELLIQQKHAVIQTTLLPPVNGIKQQMTQLFANLISNALKFCEKEPIIKITSRDLSHNEIEQDIRLDGSSEYLEITVSDNGIGFLQEFSEQIFNIFQRLNSRSEFDGTGIGLAICKKIAANHGGLISATGNLGQGAKFMVILLKATLPALPDPYFESSVYSAGRNIVKVAPMPISPLPAM